MNLQVIEKRTETDGMTLDVEEIFHTIQGEGPYAGRPAVFVRLAGCNLQCPGCDTDYTSKRKSMSVEDVIKQVKEEAAKTVTRYPLRHGEQVIVVLTGGEPFRQTLGPLVKLLATTQFTVQIETNGTLYDPVLVGWWHTVTVVCSPKAGTVTAALQPVVHSLKYVMRDGEVDPSDGLPTCVLGATARPARPWSNFVGEIYLQPMDEGDPIKNAANMRTVVASCLKYGYRLCVQLHKLPGVELP